MRRQMQRAVRVRSEITAAIPVVRLAERPDDLRHPGHGAVRGGERAHDGMLQRLQTLRAYPLADVFDGGDVVQHLAARIADRRHGEPGPHLGAVLAAVAAGPPKAFYEPGVKALALREQRFERLGVLGKGEVVGFDVRAGQLAPLVPEQPFEKRVGEQDPAVGRDVVDAHGREIENGAETLLAFRHPMFRLPLRLAQTQAVQAVGDVVGQLVQELQFLVVERLRLGGEDTEYADRLNLVEQRKAGGRLIAAGKHGLLPARRRHGGADVPHELCAPCANRQPGRPAPPFVVRPGRFDIAKQARVAGARHRFDGAARIVPHEPDPGRAITAFFHRDAAHFAQQLPLVASAHQCTMAGSGNRTRARQPLQALFCALYIGPRAIAWLWFHRRSGQRVPRSGAHYGGIRGPLSPVVKDQRVNGGFCQN